MISTLYSRVTLLGEPFPLTLIGVVCAIWLVYKAVLHPLVLHPLRRLPHAHWSVAFPIVGHFYMLNARYRSRNNATTYAAHQKHGPVVRLGYNEISVNSYLGGLKTVYAGGWEKHEWYARQFANFGVMNMFSTLGHTPHAAKKRIMANAYSKSFLATSPQVAANAEYLLRTRVLPCFADIADLGEALDVHELNNAMTMDFMTAFQFGINHSTNFIQDVQVRKKYLHLYHSRRNWQFISSEIPPWVRKFLQMFGISLYPSFIHEANEWLEDWSRQMCDAAEADVSDEKQIEYPGAEPLMLRTYHKGLFALRVKYPMAGVEIHPHLDEGMNFSALATPSTVDLNTATKWMPDTHTTKLEVYSDMVDQLAAGHETSALALTYLYYELSINAELQERLYEELNPYRHSFKWLPEGSVDELNLPKAKDLDALPFLNALLQETLRLHAPIPGMQPRISPRAQKGKGESVGPPGHEYHNLPGNIRISAMPYALHRIESVFPETCTFKPERWLDSSDEQLAEMNRHFWAFGSGGRGCIGKHFAIMEIKLLVAALISNYRIMPVDGGADGIEEVDAYTTRPRSGKLVVRLERR